MFILFVHDPGENWGAYNLNKQKSTVSVHVYGKIGKGFPRSRSKPKSKHVPPEYIQTEYNYRIFPLLSDSLAVYILFMFYKLMNIHVQRPEYIFCHLASCDVWFAHLLQRSVIFRKFNSQLNS